MRPATTPATRMYGLSRIARPPMATALTSTGLLPTTACPARVKGCMVVQSCLTLHTACCHEAFVGQRRAYMPGLTSPGALTE